MFPVRPRLRIPFSKSPYKNGTRTHFWSINGLANRIDQSFLMLPDLRGKMSFAQTWICLFLIIDVTLGERNSMSIVRVEDVFTFVSMSTNIKGEEMLSSVVALDYSYPLLLIKEGVFAKASPLNMSEEDPEVRYLRSHESYMQKVRTAMDNYTGPLAIKSSCTSDHGKLICVLSHIKNKSELVLKSTYYFDDPPEPGKSQNYYQQVMSTPEGDKFRELFLETFKTWEMFEKIHDVAARWKILHKKFLETCVPEEIVAEITIIIRPEPRVLCKVKSGVPVVFVVSVYTTEGEDVRTDTSGLRDTFYGAEASIPVTPKDGMIATCTVNSEMGWTKKQEARLRIQGTQYIFEEVAPSWDEMFPKMRSRTKTSTEDTWSLTADILDLHPSTRILVLLTIAVLYAMIRRRMRERRRTDRVAAPPIPPPRRIRHKKDQ